MAIEIFKRKNESWHKDEGRATWLEDEKPKKIKGFEFYTYVEFCKTESSYRQNDASVELTSELKESIESSKQLLKLGDDWDGEGSLGYSESTLNRAIKFLTDNAVQFWKDNAVWVSAPEICPGPDGSIDLLWKLADRELLINIPIDENEPASYYGDDSKNNNITKGKLNLSEKHQWILMWLMK